MTGIIIGIAVALVVAFAIIWLKAAKENSTPWYSIPFEKGSSYETKETIFGNFDKLEKGTVLTYESTGFSRYDGYIGFFFKDTEGKKRRWDIADDQDPASLAEGKFEKV